MPDSPAPRLEDLADPRLRVVSVGVDDVEPHPRNPRLGDVAAIANSLMVHGQYRPIVVQKSTGYVLAGNHTLKGARRLRDNGAQGWDTIDAVVLDVDDVEAKRIMLVDNRSAELGTYDDGVLAELLRELPDLEGTGYEPADLDDVLERMAAGLAALDGESAPADDEVDEEPEAGTLLALADVSVAEPTRYPALGSRWKVGPHLLVVAKVSTEHELWSGDLDGRRFCPYPEPYITCSAVGHTDRLLLVQPNRYLAGHLLDKHDAFYPGQIEELA